jgi:hypothetical protein
VGGGIVRTGTDASIGEMASFSLHHVLLTSGSLARGGDAFPASHMTFNTISSGKVKIFTSRRERLSQPRGNGTIAQASWLRHPSLLCNGDPAQGGSSSGQHLATSPASSPLVRRSSAALKSLAGITRHERSDETGGKDQDDDRVYDIVAE